MIVATKSVDALLKGVISPDKLMISRIDSISKSLQLDPNISTPKKEMFVVSNDDIKNARLRNEFLSAVKSKHPECLIMYINKNGRDIKEVDSSLFDAYLVKPKREDIRDKFCELVIESEAKAKFKIKDTIDTPEKFNFEEANPVNEPEVPEEPAPEEAPLVTLEVTEEIKEEPKEPEPEDMNILDRIRRSESWAALTAITEEINASRIVQEITQVNASFNQSEQYVAALCENITAILSNPDYDTSTKLSRVRSIMHDRAYIKAKNNSIIEQSVESIITALVDKAKQEVESKTQEMDERILRALQNRGSEEAPNVRLATIVENRAKLLVELSALDLEIKGMASTCINTINDTVDNVISSSVSTTDSPILDSQMKARYGEIVPENLLTVLDNLFQSGQNSSLEFSKMSQAVNSTIRKLYNLLAYYQEESEVLADTIRFLRANKVEDTVLANTIMKKTNRLFITTGDFDSIALSYMISKHHSRKNNNVLLLDLTNNNVLDLFGIKSKLYSEFMEREHFNDKFLVVSTYSDTGISLSTIEDCQRLSTRLLHYAKHYSMINIMCTPEQRAIIEHFAPEVLSLTYMVDCYPSSIMKMSQCINSIRVDNTASRVVLVNYISDSAQICRELGIIERLDMQLTTCKPVPEIRYCSLHKQDPYEVESIVEDCGGVLRTC